jgi:hypothetical protein
MQNVVHFHGPVKKHVLEVIARLPGTLSVFLKDKGGLGIKDLHIQNRCLLQ